MVLGGGGEMDAWYQTSERMRVLSTSTLPLSERSRPLRAIALFLTFWVRESQSVAEFSGVMGSKTPSVLRSRGAAFGKEGP